MQFKLTLPQISNRSIALLSFIYKNLALVLLTSLFAVFIFYGVLIVFFLLSTNWAAPVTLSEGHELVERIKYKINDLKVRGNLIEQKIEDAKRETEFAERAREDAKILMNYVGKTVDRELAQRTVRLDSMTVHLQRMKTVQKTMAKAVSKLGAIRELEDKFNKRLINRQTYNSGQLAILEMKYRLVMLKAEIATQKNNRENLIQSLSMLESLRNALLSSDAPSLTAADTELVPLANQAISVKTALKNANAELNSAQRQLELLTKNQLIVHEGIDSLSRTPLARAINAPVVVLFTPYKNIDNFSKNAPLFSCRLGIIWCKKVGRVIGTIDGETTYTHPFFGKTLRGSFIEAQLDDSEAAEKELLHVNRPPLFF
jgi:hypothetical protein